MTIGQRIKVLRQQSDMSQGEIQKRTGLLRCHISRVENGHTVPGIETLEKMARALDVPMYRLFYDGDKLPLPANPSRKKTSAEAERGRSAKQARFMALWQRLLSRVKEDDRDLLLALAQKMASKRSARKGRSATELIN
jgi:transcriptional regulator with XRE-family HTH domain